MEVNAPQCGECGAAMVLRSSRYGRFYGCSSYPTCTGTHGAHQSSGKPLGVPADAETRARRAAAHRAFDAAAERLGMTKRERYGWLQMLMDKRGREAHISMFTADECRRLVEIMAVPCARGPEGAQ